MPSKVDNRHIDLSSLPVDSRGHTSWVESIGLSCHVEYDDFSFDVLLLKYDKDTRYITYQISGTDIVAKSKTYNFRLCNFGKAINCYTSEYKYRVGEMVNNMEIIETTRIAHGKSSDKAYVLRCPIDGYVVTTSEDRIIRGDGCNLCRNRVCVKDINSIWATDRDYVKYFCNIEDSYSHTTHSNKVLKFKCPLCGFIKSMKLNDLTSYGFRCNACGDGISYPEKFMTQLLNQTNEEFKAQATKLTLHWAENKRYDFYLPKYNTIIEVHGNIHYEYTGLAQTLEYVKDNDILKESVARSNGISNYLTIDCRKSNKDWIKESIMKSELPTIIGFKSEDIDWSECDRFASGSMVHVVANIWNSGIYCVKDISNQCHMSVQSTRMLLNKAKELDLCDYNRNVSFKHSSACKKIYQYSIDGEFMRGFDSISDAAKELDISYPSISSCNAGRYKTGMGYIWRDFKVKNIIEFEKGADK